MALPHLRRRYALPILGVVRPGATAAALAACSCGGENISGDDGIAGEDPSGSNAGEAKPGEAKTEPDPVEPQLDCSHAVFGLRVPRGMKPNGRG